MANFFSLQDGNLTDISVYGYSLSTAEVLNNTTGIWLSTVDAYSPVFTGNGSSISAVAINLSARAANPTTSTLTLKISSASSIVSETYNISSFTGFDGSNNSLTTHPQNWQILKLTNPYSLANLSSARISLATLSSNTLALVCSSSNNNYNKMVLVTNSLNPNINDDIHIGGALKGLTVEPRTITAVTSSYRNLYIHNQGTLNFPLTSNVTLNINGSAGLQVTSDGTLNIGTSSSSIPLSTTHVINLSNTQIDVHNGGNLNVYGYSKLTTTSLISTHNIGSRTFTTTNNISSDWKVGDILSFKPNLSSRRSFDELVLSSFTGSNIFTTILSSLCTHTGSADSFSFIPDVYNLSRNVTIQGSTSVNRGTIRTIDAAKTSINYAQLSNFGINSLNKNGLVIGNNLSGSTTLSGISILSDNQSYVRNIIPLTGRSVQNLNITNSTVNKSNLLLSSLSVNNVVFSNNYILSSNETGFQVTNVSGSNINMSNNTTIGSLSYGTLLVNNSLTGTYGALNYNSGLQGVMVSGTNTGTIVGGSINSARDGVYVDSTTTTTNLSALTFQNIIANNNRLDGFVVSGNNLNYLTPLYLNINGLTANNNSGYGFEAYNITGNLSSLTINNNVSGGVRTSIGNGPTTFDGLTSILSSIPMNILSGYNYSPFIIKNTLLSSNSSIGITLDSCIFCKFSLENSTISATIPIVLNTTRNLIEGSYLFNNCYLGSINFIDLNKYQPNIYRTAGFGFTNYNKISGNHFTYLPMGVKLRDTLLYDNSTSDLVSERLTPTSRTLKLKSGSKYVALNSGESTSVKVNVLVSSNYNGNLPRLMLRGNPAAGINNDTAIGIFNPSFGYDIFTEIIGNETVPVIDNCILEFYVDCNGTQGYVCVDTWTAN